VKVLALLIIFIVMVCINYGGESSEGVWRSQLTFLAIGEGPRIGSTCEAIPPILTQQADI
jgi:hypothetical protein